MKTLTPKSVQTFKELYLRSTGINLSNQEAEQLGLYLLAFIRLIYRPIPRVDEEFFNHLSLEE